MAAEPLVQSLDEEEVRTLELESSDNVKFQVCFFCFALVRAHKNTHVNTDRSQIRLDFDVDQDGHGV